MHTMIERFGPSHKEKLPAFFYFALSGYNSLKLDPYNQPVLALKNLPVRVFSWTLPGHGEGLKDTDAMKVWYESWKKGEDPLKDFLKDSLRYIDELVQEGIIDETRMGVGGLSRGAYAAVRLASIEPRLKTIVGFAPLTKPSLLEEFQGEIYQPLENYIDQLIDRKVWFSIGNLDTRVGTKSAFDFIEKLAQKNQSEGKRSPMVELTIKPSIGYKGHGTSPETFKMGADWLLKQFNIVKP